jgi:hypothetical protein
MKVEVRFILSHFLFFPNFVRTFHYRLYSRRHGHPRLSEDGGLSNLQQEACSYRSTTIIIFTRTPASISVHRVQDSKGASVEWLGGKRGHLSRAIRHITASARRLTGAVGTTQGAARGVKEDRILWSRFTHFMTTNPELGGGLRDIS